MKSDSKDKSLKDNEIDELEQLQRDVDQLVGPQAATAMDRSSCPSAQVEHSNPQPSNAAKPLHSPTETTVAANKQSVQPSIQGTEDKTHKQGVYKAMPLRSSFKGVHKATPKNDLIYTQPCHAKTSETMSISSSVSEGKKTSDYENIEALQYHDYQNLPPMSAQSSVMNNFKKECAQIKGSLLTKQASFEKKASHTETVQPINADSSQKVPNVSRVPSCTSSESEHTQSLKTHNATDSQAVSAMGKSNTTTAQSESEDRTNPSVSVATMANRINQSAQNQAQEKSVKLESVTGQHRASSASTKGYAVSSLDTPLTSHPRSKPAANTVSLHNSNAATVQACPGMQKHPMQVAQVSYVATRTTEVTNQKVSTHPPVQAKPVLTERRPSNPPTVSQANIQGQPSMKPNVELPTKSVSNIDESDNNDTKSHTPNKCFHKVLPPYDKTHHLKSTGMRNSAAESPAAQSSLQHNTSEQNNSSNVGNLNEMESRLKNNDKQGEKKVGDCREQQAKVLNISSVTTTAQSLGQHSVPPAVHTKQSSNHITNVAQQLINSINKNVENVPQKESANKDDMPDLVNRIESDTKGQVTSRQDLGNAKDEDKVLNNKVDSISEKIIPTDEEKNHIKTAESNILESPKSPKKNPWFFGTHKNTMVFPVVIVKNPGVGFTIEGGIGTQKCPSKPTDNGIYVAHVASDGPASGTLRTGDKILQANGVDFSYLHLEKAMSFLNTKEPTLSLMISRV